MFIARNSEKKLLEELYSSSSFEFMVMYGRRRVGKTFLLQNFSKKHTGIFFSAQEKNKQLNLRSFARVVQNFLHREAVVEFSDWENAFQYLTDSLGSERLLLIIDEFPFIASDDPSIKSVLQHIIDHQWKQKNIFLILCGSSISFMENEVMGYKSPLYGRATSQLEIKPFDYLDSSLFFPKYTNEEKLLAYGVLGGIPCYLQTFNDDISIANNIAKNILRTGTFLREEPQLLMKMELREPAVYNSIFESIATGASRLNEISTKIQEESNKCSKYINTLKTLKLVNKIVPCGEPQTSKKGIYCITDNFFAFWYKYIFSNDTYYDMLGYDEAADEIMSDISVYMGHVFEGICYQYILRMAKKKQLPFVPVKIGRWWGNNPIKKMQDDIDILALSKDGKKAIFCECKWRNTEFDIKEYDDLMRASSIFTNVKEKYYYIFNKSEFKKSVIERAKVDNVRLIGIDDLFNTSLI